MEYSSLVERVVLGFLKKEISQRKATNIPCMESDSMPSDESESGLVSNNTAG